MKLIFHLPKVPISSWTFADDRTLLDFGPSIGLLLQKRSNSSMRMVPEWFTSFGRKGLGDEPSGRLGGLGDSNQRFGTHTPPKTTMEPAKWRFGRWLDLFQSGDFQVPAVRFRECRDVGRNKIWKTARNVNIHFNGFGLLKKAGRMLTNKVPSWNVLWVLGPRDAPGNISIIMKCSFCCIDGQHQTS